MQPTTVKDELKQIVEEGGGIWVGVQDCSSFIDLALFNSPKTGSTLALRVNDVTVKNVSEKIRKSDEVFAGSTRTGGQI